jgi:large subunit ribosomal protein L18
MFSKVDKNAVRAKRHYRQRKDMNGTNDRPRLNVYRSTTHIYAQVIDDEAGNTLVAASTLDAEIKEKIAGKTKTQQAAMVGELVGKRAIEKGVKKVVFDRGGYLYTGRVAALADGARKAGLDF